MLDLEPNHRPQAKLLCMLRWITSPTNSQVLVQCACAMQRIIFQQFKTIRIRLDLNPWSLSFGLTIEWHTRPLSHQGWLIQIVISQSFLNQFASFWSCFLNYLSFFLLENFYIVQKCEQMFKICFKTKNIYHCH